MHTAFSPLKLALAAALLMIAALLTVRVPSAEAHQVCTTHPEGSYACILSDHRTVIACDQDRDGNRVYARTYVFGQVQDPIYDPDGAGGNCGFRIFGAGTLDSFNVCVQNEGCGAPVYWYQF